MWTKEQTESSFVSYKHVASSVHQRLGTAPGPSGHRAPFVSSWLLAAMRLKEIKMTDCAMIVPYRGTCQVSTSPESILAIS